MKKIFVTGHTRGIGKGMYDAFIDRGWDVSGFSRSTGWDINDSKAIDGIVEKAKDQDIDIFINNAYSNWGQIDLLYSLFNEWRYEQKMIVNISSYAADRVGSRRDPRKYSVVKNALSLACAQLQNLDDSLCKVVDVKYGRVDAGKNKNIDVPKLTVKEAVDSVLYIVDQPENVLIRSITVTPSKN